MDDIEEMRIPMLFILNIVLLEFQVEICLIIKIVTFPIIFGFHRLLMWICRCCPCGKRCYPIDRTCAEDLEIDTQQRHHRFYRTDYGSDCG